MDQWTGFDAAADTVDGVHPNTGGFQKMANRWYPALAQVLDGVVPPQPTATASPSSSPTASPTSSSSPSSSVSPTTGGGSSTATYTVMSQWAGNFQGQVTVTNTSAAASKGWTTTFTFGNGQQVTQSWNTTLAQTGATVTAANVSYNGALGAGASTSLGFLASWNNVANPAPAVSCTLS